MEGGGGGAIAVLYDTCIMYSNYQVYVYHAYMIINLRQYTCP